MMSVYPSCMQRPGLPGVGFPLSLPWSFPSFSQQQNALTLQVQIPSFPRPAAVVTSQSLHKESMVQKSAPVKPKPSPTTKSTPTSFTIASILSKNNDRDKPTRSSPVVSPALNVTGHASTVAGSISPSTPLSGTPKTPLYYIYHPAAQHTPFSFPAATTQDHDVQRSPLSRIGAPTPLTLGDMVRRYGKSWCRFTLHRCYGMQAACNNNHLFSSS